VNLGRWIGLFVLAIAAYVLWQIRDLLLVVFAAIVLATSLNQAVKTFRKWGLTRSWAVLLATGCLLAFVVGFVWLVVPTLSFQFRELLELVPAGVERFNEGVDGVYQGLPEAIRPYFPNLRNLEEQLRPVVNGLLTRSAAFLSSSLGAALNVLLILVLALMMLVNPNPYRQGFIRLFPSFYRRRIDQILEECEAALGEWIKGALLSMAVIAVLSSLGLWMIGVRAVLALGVLAGVLNFIPNLGPTLSVIAPMLIALLDVDAPWKPLAVLGLYIGIQQFESNLLTPYIMAQQVNLLPAVTLLAQVVFASLFGFWGLLLALPLTVVMQILVRRVLVEDILDRWHTDAQLVTPPVAIPAVEDGHAVSSSDIPRIVSSDAAIDSGSPSVAIAPEQDPWD
jgi:predicted PurR-regulated permease PerM